MAGSFELPGLAGAFKRCHKFIGEMYQPILELPGLPGRDPPSGAGDLPRLVGLFGTGRPGGRRKGSGRTLGSVRHKGAQQKLERQVESLGDSTATSILVP